MGILGSMRGIPKKSFASLYRTYRPVLFADIVGQEHVTGTLKNAISLNRINHAYLLYGPRGTGKTTTARVFAKRLNCTNATSPEPCGSCAACISLQRGTMMDLIEIDAASNRGIDDIRALREATTLSPSTGAYKIYIIDEVHMLTEEAFAALLKTLEEPPSHVVFVLATTEFHKVPETISSRCQVFRFRRATRDEMSSRLSTIISNEDRALSKDIIEFIIARSDGCYRDAESLLGQILTLHEGEPSLNDILFLLGMPPVSDILDFLYALVHDDIEQAFQIIRASFEQGIDVEQFIIEAIRSARDGLVLSIQHDTLEPEFTKDPRASFALPRIIRALVQARIDLQYVPEPVIALQLAAASVCTLRQKTNTPSRQEKPDEHRIEEGHASTANALWDKLVEEIKKVNRVASTFLRAIKAVSSQGDSIILEASYPLHHTYFNKEDNKKLVEDTLSGLLKKPVTVTVTLRTNVRADQSKNTDSQNLLESVKEVFGVAK